MNGLTPLRTPASPVTELKEGTAAAATAFTFPTTKQLSKGSRLTLSKQEISVDFRHPYRLLATSSTLGWFAAVTYEGSCKIALSPLNDLRSAAKDVKADTTNFFTPKRTITLPTACNLLVLAHNDQRLLAGLDNGHILVFDAHALFTEGPDDTTPLTDHDTRGGPLRQIASNPGAEPSLSELAAVLTEEGAVILLDVLNGFQGGWAPAEGEARVTAVSWSPKGKQLALGLESGHILTFTPNNREAPQKHVPPTSSKTPMVSMQWTGPAHTFRTVYCSQDEPEDPIHHIVTFDARANSVEYIPLEASFAVSERYPPSSSFVTLPRWEGEQNVLVLAGDATASDIEVLGHSGMGWHQEVSDNPLAVPLKEEDFSETVLLALELDLTDTTPVMIAYMNDGTLQLWYLEGPNPYPGLITPSAIPAPSAMEPAVSGMSMDEAPKSTPPAQEATPTSVFGQPSGLGFGQAPATSPFGTPSFGQPSFGQAPSPSAFSPTSATSAQPATLPAFGAPSGFGQMASNASAFGQSSGNNSGFGQAANNTSAFGQTSNNASAFGKPSFGTTSTPSAFGQSSFGQTAAPAFGQSGFGQTSNPASGFGSTGFGQTAQPSPAANASGGGGFGAFANSGTSAFGKSPAFGSAPQQNAPTSGGFGGFAGGARSAFGQTSMGPPPTPQQTTPPPESPVDDSAMDGMGSMGLGESDDDPKPKPASVFGSMPPPADKPATSAFGAPASTSPFASTASGIKPASGFGAFGGFSSSNSVFGGKKDETPKPTFGSGAFASVAADAPKPSSAFGSSGFGQSAFGKPAFGQSAFGHPSLGPASNKPAFGRSSFGTAPASGGGFGAFANKPASLTSTPVKDEKPTPPSGGGFSAFASRTASFTTKPDESKPMSAFGTGGGFGGGAQAAPSEGKPSVFGATAPSADVKPEAASAPVKEETVPEKLPSKQDESMSQDRPSTPPTPPVKVEEIPVKVEEKSPSPPAHEPASPSPPQAPVTPSKTPEPAMPSSTTPPTPLTPATPQEKEKPQSGFGFNLKASPSPFTTPGFGQPASTSSFIKPAAGFGSAGLASPDSPFNKPKTSTSTSAFGSAFKKFETPKKEATSAPTFGAPSIPGLRKSAFTTTPTTPVSAGEPSSGGFAAFSKGGSPFHTPPDAPKTAFKDLLKGKEGKGEPQKPAVFSPAAEKPKTPTEPRKSAFPSPAKDDGSTTPAGTPSGPVRASVFSKPTTEGKKDEEQERSRSPKALSDTKSGSASSVASSFVDVSKEDVHSEEEEEEEQEEVPEEGEDDFLSDLSQSDGESADDSPSFTPSKPPPQARSQSTTPKPVPQVVEPEEEPPSDEYEEDDSEDAEDEQDEDVTEESRLSTIEEESQYSTTPPDSPVKRVPKSSHAPTPLSSGLRPPGSGPLFGGIGLGKSPASRPARSSPLASTSVNASDEEASDDTEKKPLARPEIVAPKPKEATPPPEAPTPRTGTPPLLSTIGFGKSRQSATPSPTNVPPPSSRGPSPAAPQPAPATKSVFGQAWGLPPAQPPSAPSPSSGFFGAAKPATTPGPSSSPSSNALFGPPKISATPGASASSPGLFGSAIPPASPAGPPLMNRLSPFSMPAPAPSAETKTPINIFATPATPSPPPRVPTPPQEGMQKECAELVMSIERDLASLGRMAADAGEQLKKLNGPVGGPRRKEDLGDPAKWSLGDLVLFGRTLVTFSKDLTELKAARNKERQLAKELRASMLKANTRKEEIARFSKAQSDPEFAKMLKTRTLGPEHLETQTNLRRNLRAVRDRVQALEDNLNALKKKLSQQKSGQVSMRPPTLDVLNRTYRNIDLAINDDRQLIDDLVARMANVNFNDAKSRSAKLKDVNRRDSRLPDPQARPLNVTPSVAVTTAAALNAERSAARLKRALLAARPEPLLNKTASRAPAPPAVFQTPQKPGATPRTPAFDPQDAAWASFGEDKFSPQTPTPTLRRGAGSGVRRHQPSPVVKKAPMATPSPPPNFNWGPLPPPRTPMGRGGALPVPILKQG